MTEALTPLFEGKKIRVIEQDNEPWFPIKDLAEAWGVKINTLYQILNRQSGKFTGHVSDVHVTSTPTEDESWHKSVNEQGLYLILGAINTDRLKDRDVAMAILRFQRWVPELIQQYRKKELAPVVAPPFFELDEVVAYDLQEAREIAKLTDTDPKVLQAAVLRKHQYPELADAIRPANLPALASAAPETSQPGIWMTPTDIGQECSLSARQVNSWLYNHDFQYPDGQVWRLTAKGEAYGEEYLFTTPYKHTETRIRWHRSILVASGLKRPLPESQMALPARA